MITRRVLTALIAVLWMPLAAQGETPAHPHQGNAESAAPLTELRHEHEVIGQMLQVLDRMADQAGRGELDRDAASKAVDFLSGFADKCHHAKEEGYLFPVLEKTALAAPAADLRKEHEQARAEVSGMKDAVEAADAGALALHAQAYTKLLRQHIEKENEHVFTEADHTLERGALQGLAEDFKRVEAEETGEGVHEKYLNLVQELSERYGVSRDGDAGARRSTHHDH